MRPAAPMPGGGRFRIDPDPPVAGQPATVTYIGPASEVEYQVDGQPPVTVQPDQDGKFVIDPVPHGNELALSDNLGIPGYLLTDIIDLN